MNSAGFQIAIQLRSWKAAVSPSERLQNVKDSDGTVIIYPGKLSGGTEQTVRFCVEQQRPHQTD